jgi:hypothetical protein
MASETDYVAGTLHLKIHPRKTWFILPNLFLVFFWGTLGTRGIHYLLAPSQRHGAGSQSTLFALVSYVCAVYFLYLVFNTLLFGYDLVAVSPSTFDVQSSLLGVTISRKEFDNQAVQNLRYEEWSGGRGGQQNGIRFEHNGKTITFARQATEDDSWALIDRMCEVYKFSTPEPTPSPAVINWSK